MAGQREQGFRATPGYNAPNVNPAATMQTNGEQAIAAKVQGQGSALAGLGGAMSSFFGTLNKTVEQIGEIEHRESLVEIERQRKARAAQAQTDHATGTPRDQGLNVYQDYKGAYDVAVPTWKARESLGVSRPPGNAAPPCRASAIADATGSPTATYVSAPSPSGGTAGSIGLRIPCGPCVPPIR